MLYLKLWYNVKSSYCTEYFMNAKKAVKLFDDEDKEVMKTKAFRLPSVLIAKIEEIKGHEGKGYSEIVRRLIEFGIEEYEKRLRKKKG